MANKRDGGRVKPGVEFLQMAGRSLGRVTRDVEAMVDMGEKMGKLMLEGGGLYAVGVAKWFPSEMCHRAGGLMGIKGGMPVAKKDIGYFALPDPRWWEAHTDETLKKLMKGKGELFVVGREEELVGVDRKRFSGFTGGASVEEGIGELAGRKPWVGVRHLEQFVRGWITLGEALGMCTRAERMPMLWMSVWLEGGLVRNNHFVRHDNLREPWGTEMFHERVFVPALARGYVAGEFLREVERIRSVLLGQAEKLEQAGRWMAAAVKGGKKVHAVSVGHSHPAILELDKTADFPVRWAGSVSDLNKAVPEDLGKGDVALHWGYSPVDWADVKRILDRGVKFVYSSPYGKRPAMREHENLLWIDLPWRPADATVDIPGYSVRLCPMSSSAQAMALGAVMAEMAAGLK